MAQKTRLKTVQVGFTAGELDPVLLGRIDKELYYKGAGLLRNVYVNPQGHLTRREGTVWVANTTGNAAARKIEFQFNTVQKYLIVFTAGEFKVYRDDVLQATVTSAPISSLTLAQIQEMKFVQSADTLLLFHKDVQTIKITRSSHTTWTATSVTYTNIPWYAFSGITVTEPAATLTPASVSGFDVVFTAGAAVFNSGHVGQYIYGKTGGIARITSYTSTTIVKCQIQVEFPTISAMASGAWELETGYEPVWSVTKGWPSCGTFHQNRLYVANSGNRPQTLWGSNVSDFFNFDIGSSADDEAINVTIDDNRVNAILNLVAGRNIQIYTTGGEFYIPTDVGNPITPAKILIVKSTSHGSSNVLPVSVGGATVFIEAGGKVVREFLYNDLEQNYNARNIALLSPHLIRTPVSMAIRQSTDENPADHLYVVNTDGTMAVLCIARDQELLAWSLFETDGTYEEVNVLGFDVYVTVKRTVNGGTVRFIERLDSTHFLDASIISTNGSPTTSWTGYSHLNGETVNVRGDDYILDDAAVSGGAFTSSLDVSEVEAGIAFLARVKTLPIEAIANGEQLTGDWKRLVHTNIRLNDSRNIIVKYGSTRYSPAFTQFGSEVLDTPVQLFSGWKKVHVSGVARDVELEITQDDPLEFEILALTVTVK
jgi:hypothetical protein